MFMKRLLFLLLFAIQSLTSFSQEIASELPINCDKKTDVFQIVEDKKQQALIFYTDKKKITALRLNSALNIMDSIKVSRNSEELNDLLGYSMTENTYNLLWAGSKSKNITIQSFDFEKKETLAKHTTLNFENEKLFQKLTVNGVFYMLTIVKASNIINLYKFENDSFTKKTIDLSSKRFLSSENKFNLLYTIISENRLSDPAFSFELISNETPPSLVLSSRKRKVYSQGNQIVLTLDVCKLYSQIIRINLNDFSAQCQFIAQPKIEEANYPSGDSNSFLLNDKIIQLRSKSDILLLKFKNQDGEELKSYELKANEEIPFKNSDIIQENGNVNNVRILDKSNQLIRKIDNLNPSISSYLLGDKIYLTIGGVSSPQNNNAVMYGGMIGGFTGAIIAAALTSNYSINNLNSYNNRKVVYIHCIFDTNFNHIDTEAQKLAFDKLRFFAEEKESHFGQTIFKMNNTLYYGGYSTAKKKYLFYRFND
ncbi:hypothetical protein FCR2A7T_03460 [Flavobacterium cauense R2A-7]|uniref:Uncharacterized protein n=2 Tax=Flavobacterium TaxID=237 RepID=V6S5G1_9FLAO|nr:hypothetical protein FCR2A7T_03460 [Flavobacterium cauense R2A-7]TWI13103.1 hypothetical protein IP98_01084 [Flavobacterium cauense R2A-7]